MTHKNLFQGFRVLRHSLALLALAAIPLLAQVSTETLQFSDLKLTNHTGTSVVLSWRTNKPTVSNIVFYGRDRSNLDKSVADSSSINKPSTSHYVQLIYLDLNATYYYRVQSDGVNYSVSPSGVDSVVTFPQKFASTQLLLTGQVIDKESRDPLERVLVRSFLRSIRTGTGGAILQDSTMWFSDLTDNDGKFNFYIQNYRTYSGGLPVYYQGLTWLHLIVLGAGQEVVQDSILLTTPAGPSNYQDLGAFELIDIRKLQSHGRVQASSPVLTNGRSASLVWVTVLDKTTGQPVPNVAIALKASPGTGVTYLQPQLPTDANGRTWGLVRSTLAQDVLVEALNATSPDSTPLDTVATVSFVSPPGDITQDKTPPFIYFATDFGNTDENAKPYPIRASVIDNFTPDVKLVWTVSGNVFTDTMNMASVANSDDFSGSIKEQPYNSVVNYFILAQDSSGFKVSSPDSFINNPFLLPYRFEVLPSNNIGIARMGITNTTDLFNRTDATLKPRVDTWVTTTVGVRSAVIKWRNFNQGSIFFDVPMSHFGAHYWGNIPAQPVGGRVEYFIQVIDSLGRVDTDRRRAPLADLYDYEVLAVGPRSESSYADTSDVLGTQDVRKSNQAVAVDLNGDRYPDVVTANYGEANSVYFYNRINGALNDVTSQALGLQVSEKTTSVVAVDVDADDDMDLIFGNDGTQSRLYINNGQGRFDDVTFRTFGGTVRMPAEAWHTVMVLADDFNGDGAIDLYFVNNDVGGEVNRLLFNDSLGVFRDVTTKYMLNPPADQSVWALAGDVNGDGYTDIVVINRAQNHVVYYNNGKGLFQRREIVAPTAGLAQGGALVDVDLDGDLDLVVVENNTQQNELFINNGAGTFTRDTQGRLPAESDNTYGVLAFDANLDGYKDLLYLNSGPNRLLLNDSKGFFSDAPAAMFPTGTAYTTAAALADFNQDNRPDIYLCEMDRRNSLMMGRSRQINPADLPSRFGLLSPGDLDTVNAQAVTFIWNSSVSRDTSDKVRYSFELSLDSLFSATRIVDQFDNLVDTTLTVTGLTDNIRYWWRTSAQNSLLVPVYSNRIFTFELMTSYTGGAPVLSVILSQSPVLTGYLNVYIISSEPLAAPPQITINLNSIPVSRLGQNDIWRGQYFARSGFLLSVTGVNLAGRVGEYVKTYSTLLASAGASASTESRPVWIESLDGGGRANILVQHNLPIVNESLKRKLESLDIEGQGPLGAALEAESYTFSPLDGPTGGIYKVCFRRAPGSAYDPSAAVCRLDEGQWRPLQTTFDPGPEVYSAESEKLGTFALLSGLGGLADLPRAFALSQNVPNPFNPSTTISYRVPEEAVDGRVTIKVYNLRGALVRTLVDRSLRSGLYAVEWDGRDDTGHDLSSGVYFYRLKAGATAISRKMVLIR